MAHPKVKLSDNTGNEVSVTSNRLDVNAHLAATPTIDIGDVSLLLGGTAASTNAGTMDDQTLRITLATDDTHFGAVGASADVDGVMHGQLRFIGDNVKTVADYWGVTTRASGVGFSEGQYGFGLFGVRNDTLATLCSDDNDYTPLQVNASGALYVAGTVDLGSTDNAVLNAMVVDLAAMEALLITIDSDTDAIKTAVEILDNAIDGSEMQVDIVSSATLSVNSHAVTNAGTFAVQVDGDALTSLQLLDDAIYVDDADWSDGSSKHMLVGGLYQSTEQSVTDGDVAPIQVNDQGMLKIDLMEVQGVAGHWLTRNTGDSASMVHISTESYAVSDAGIPAMVVMKDVLAAGASITDGEYTPLAVDTQGALYTTHGMTGMVSGKNTGVDDTTAEVIVGAAVCKRIDMQASPSNTGDIWVGGSNVAVNQGIKLAPGDFYSIDINNTDDVYVLATVDEEDIAYTYYT